MNIRLIQSLCMTGVFIIVFIVLPSTVYSEGKDSITIHLDDTGNLRFTWVSLPYDSSYYYAADIYDEINSLGGDCDRVYRWDTTIDQFQYYGGVRAGTNFQLYPGESYGVTVIDPYDWLVTGEHDPVITVDIEVSGELNINWLSIPYDSTALTASDLKTELINDGIPVNRVFKWNTDTDDITYYESPRAGIDFSLEDGYGIGITVSGPGIWTPDVLTDMTEEAQQ